MRGKADERSFKAVLDAVQQGGSNRAAAAAAGITEQVLYRWIARGDIGEEPFATFTLAFQRAKDDAVSDRVLSRVAAINRASGSGSMSGAAACVPA